MKGPYGQFAWGELGWGELVSDTVEAEDTGVGNDVVILVKDFLITDNGIGVDGVTPEMLIEIEDSGGGVEVVGSVLAQLFIQDSGIAIETIYFLGKELEIKDTGIAEELIRRIHSVQDSGIGIDLPIKNLSDSGIGVDVVEERGFVIPDDGVGVESFMHVWNVIIIIG